jgi:hypothetical protein
MVIIPALPVHLRPAGLHPAQPTPQRSRCTLTDNSIATQACRLAKDRKAATRPEILINSANSRIHLIFTESRDIGAVSLF